MRKKDYELIAGSLAATKSWITSLNLQADVYRIICENLANTLNRDDPKFNKDKFLTACGIEQSKPRLSLGMGRSVAQD